MRRLIFRTKSDQIQNHNTHIQKYTFFWFYRYIDVYMYICIQIRRKREIERVHFELIFLLRMSLLVVRSYVVFVFFLLARVDICM